MNIITCFIASVANPVTCKQVDNLVTLLCIRVVILSAVHLQECSKIFNSGCISEILRKNESFRTVCIIKLHTTVSKISVYCFREIVILSSNQVQNWIHLLKFIICKEEFISVLPVEVEARRHILINCLIYIFKFKSFKVNQCSF